VLVQFICTFPKNGYAKINKKTIKANFLHNFGKFCGKIIKMRSNVDFFDPKDFIIIKGARVNNLKDVSIAIPRNKFVVITGLSGSGKSSLAFDTLYAEGQRRYVESLSAYARQFLGRMSKPDVDYIKGISPAIAIEQKVNSLNPRSTVGTSTEVYEYVKLLFARIGKTYSPVSGNLVIIDNISDVVDYILRFSEETQVNIFSPIPVEARNGEIGRAHV
jgi:excinuclease ABC subunit A